MAFHQAPVVTPEGKQNASFAGWEADVSKECLSLREHCMEPGLRHSTLTIGSYFKFAFTQEITVAILFFQMRLLGKVKGGHFSKSMAKQRFEFRCRMACALGGLEEKVSSQPVSSQPAFDPEQRYSKTGLLGF